MKTRRALALSTVLAFVVSAAPGLLAQSNQQKRSKQEQQDVETLVKLVDAVANGQQPAPADVPITWESNHFVKSGDGSTYIPFTISVDRSKLNSSNVSLYLRVASKQQLAAAAGAKGDDRNKERAVYPWDNIYFLDLNRMGGTPLPPVTVTSTSTTTSSSGASNTTNTTTTTNSSIGGSPSSKISRGMALPGGEYEVFLAVKEKATDQRNQPPAKLGVLRRDLSVPDFNTPELSTSSVILASTIEPLQAPLSPDQQQDNPYTFGILKVVPSAEATFAKSGELQFLFWVYGASQDANRKPDLQIEYNFHQKTAEGEKYFNKTAPQMLNAQTLPPQFDMAAGHQLLGNLSVPLTSFPAGDYRVEIKVTDKPSGKTLTQNVNFTVTA